MRRFTKIAVLAGAVAAVATVAVAQDFKREIGARKSVMQLRGFYLGQLGAMAKGEAEYDAERAMAMAASLDALAKLDASAMWPQGSDNAAMPDATRALPAIWETFPAIAENGKAFSDATAALAASAGDGVEALGAGVGEVGKACGSCHEKFRAPNS